MFYLAGGWVPIPAFPLMRHLPVTQTGDQLQRLSETLNAMFSRLEASVRRISQFTADASHELRAPVSLIRTTAEVAIQRMDRTGVVPWAETNSSAREPCREVSSHDISG